MTINKTIEGYVNRAQLAINDWQCSGELYYLAQAKAYLDVAETIAVLVHLPDDGQKKSLPLYSVNDYNDDLYDSPLEALEELDPKKFDKNETLELVEWYESEFRPHIDIEDLLEDFISQAEDAGDEASEGYTDYLSGPDLKVARTDLERQLNEVLDRWLDKHHIDAGWYERGDVIAKYKSDGTKFILMEGERNEP